MVETIIPSSYSIPLPLCPKRLLLGRNPPVVNIHLTFVLFFLVECSVSLRFVNEFPFYCLLVVVLCGPVLIFTVLVHEWGHLRMSRLLLGGRGGGDSDNNDNHNNMNSTIVLWPLGGYTFCDDLSIISSRSREDGGGGSGARGNLKDDIIIALGGPLTHVPMCAFWVGMYAAINNGEVSNFTFGTNLSDISSSRGFFSSLSEQGCLINILLFWFNVFVPVYPLDGSRLVLMKLLSCTVYCILFNIN